MALELIKRVLVVGGGTMGQQIALQCAAHGFSVVLNDVSDERLHQSEISLRRFASQMAREQSLTQKQLEEALAKVEYNADQVEASVDIDLVIEAVPEDVWLKRRVFARFHELCDVNTLFVTNTSTLLPKELAKQSGRPKQFATMHFHVNVWESNVVDLMPAKTTSPETMETLRRFAVAIDQMPIVYAREYRGYIVNRLLFGVFREALSMAAQDVVSVEEVDRAFTEVFNTEIGPFRIMDRVGLDTMLSINEFWCKRLLQLPRLDPVFRRNRQLLKSYVSQGHCGEKSGQGFYKYPDVDEDKASV